MSNIKGIYDGKKSVKPFFILSGFLSIIGIIFVLKYSLPKRESFAEEGDEYFIGYVGGVKKRRWLYWFVGLFLFPIILSSFSNSSGTCGCSNDDLIELQKSMLLSKQEAKDYCCKLNDAISSYKGDNDRDQTAEIAKTEAKRKIENMQDNSVCSTVLRKIMDYDERYYFEGINDKASSQLINLDDYDVILNIPEELDELDELESTVEKNMYGINKIHPIGWSKNGMFAFIETGNSDMLGGFNRLKVTDMVSDKNIISYTGGDEMVSLSTKEWWCLNYIEISSLLNQYEISDKGMVLEMNNEDVVIKYLSYKDISDADNNSIYSITTKFSNCRKSSNIAFCDGQTCDVQVIVTNNNTGKEKSIFKKNSFCGSKLTFVTAIKNPLEDRITILVEYEKLGFEGVYTRDIINIGCRLF